MTYEQLQQQAYALTSAEVRGLNTRIIKLYKEALDDISAQIRDAYASYLVSTDTKSYYVEMIKYDRLVKLQQSIQAAFTRYSQRAQTYIEHATSVSASNMYYRSLYTQSWAADIPFAAVPYNMIEAIVYGTSDAWRKIPKDILARYGDIKDYAVKGGTLTEAILLNRRKELVGIQRALALGLQQGVSIDKMAAQIAPLLGVVTRTKAGVSTTGALANALRVARTESLRAMNAGHYAAAQYAASTQEGDTYKQWVATLDGRTRDAHAGLDGKKVLIDQPFPGGAMYPGDFASVAQNANCRCRTITIIGDVTPTTRRGRNPVTGKNEVISYAPFTEWAKANGVTRNVYGEMYTL